MMGGRGTRGQGLHGGGSDGICRQGEWAVRAGLVRGRLISDRARDEIGRGLKQPLRQVSWRVSSR